MSEKDKDVFEVVKVAPDDKQKNRYDHVMTAQVRGGMLETDAGDHDQFVRIRDAYDGFVRLVSVGQLTKTMVEIVMSLGGVSMKPTGGIYWLNSEHWELWTGLVADVEACGPKNRFDACRVVLDEHCIAAIGQALSNEVERESAAIEKTLTDPETGLRAAGTAKKKADALRDKIGKYEQSFGLALSDLKGSLDEATRVSATATLMDVAHQMSFTLSN